METELTGLERDIAGIAALHEPVRRALYFYVVGQRADVGRDGAVQALGISRTLAAFHLDKLVEEGLLEARYRRLTARRGPGAGRPSKLYRRSDRQFAVSLPPRRYELAAQLLARGIRASEGAEPVTALAETAREFGESIGLEARRLAGAEAGCDEVLGAAETLLRDYDFEPFRGPADEIVLRNCPFHDLAVEDRDLICGMNLALMRGMVAGLRVRGVVAVLDPQPGLCCVSVRSPSSTTSV